VIFKPVAYRFVVKLEACISEGNAGYKQQQANKKPIAPQRYFIIGYPG
jgi:hypothetical protein